jgi:ABC-2 type transport system ATP-binding protein
MIIEAKGLAKNFGKKKVFNGVGVEIKKGEIFGLLGKNGAGKTVLMNILTGLILPSEGVVKYKGKNIENNVKKYWEEINWASAYQSLQLQASIKENMETFAGIYGVDKKKVGEVLELVEMSDEKIKNRKMFLLSSGEIGRINLAKALLNKPKILFLDEPTAFLDPVFKVKLIRILEKINKEWGTTIVFSSHQLDEVITLCDRVIILKEGKISYSGEIMNNKKLISYY